MSHLQQCFRKVEREVSLFARTPGQVPGCPIDSFCNHFRKREGQYCRRYRALCPEHGGFAKFSMGQAGAACGFPGEPGSSAAAPCARPKRGCLAHAGWEHVLAARLALETVQQATYLGCIEEQRAAVLERRSTRRALGAALGSKVVRHTREEAAAIQAAALEQAAAMASVAGPAADGGAKVRSDEKSQLTGGSLGLPQRFWR